MKVTAAKPDPPRTRGETLQRQRAEIRKRQLQALADEEAQLVGSIDFHRRCLNEAETRMRKVRLDQEKLNAEAEAEDDKRVLEARL